MTYLITDNPVHFVIIALLGAMIFIGWLNSKIFSSFKILWVIRWLRLVLATLSGGEILLLIFKDANPIALYAAALLIYLLMESALYWIAISLTDWEEDLQKKYLPSNDSWSAQKRHIELKDKIISQGFTKSASLSIENNDEIVRITTFDSDDKLIRLSVFFTSYGESTYLLSEAQSITANGLRISTKSNCLLAILDETENCKTRLVALEGNPLKILKIHKKQIGDSLDKLVPMPSDILADFNNTTIARIKATEKNGKLNEKMSWHTEGVFTDSGKYIFWRKLCFFKYFPQVIK